MNKRLLFVPMSPPFRDFLKALKLSGELQSIKTSVGDDGAITEVEITSVGEVAAPAKRGRKPKPKVQ